MAAPLSTLFNLNGKTALVTGATGGIGFELALTLAEAGVDIVSIQLPNDPGAQKLRERVSLLGRACHQFECNLKDYDTIPKAFESISRTDIRLDILLNCAGVTKHAKVDDTTIGDLDTVCRS